MVDINDVTQLFENFSDYTQTQDSEKKVDFISKLPPELSLLILS